MASCQMRKLEGALIFVVSRKAKEVSMCLDPCVGFRLFCPAGGITCRLYVDDGSAWFAPRPLSHPIHCIIQPVHSALRSAVSAACSITLFVLAAPSEACSSPPY
jgi:hypothetical protein